MAAATTGSPWLRATLTVSFGLAKGVYLTAEAARSNTVTIAVREGVAAVTSS